MTANEISSTLSMLATTRLLNSPPFQIGTFCESVSSHARAPRCKRDDADLALLPSLPRFLARFLGCLSCLPPGKLSLASGILRCHHRRRPPSADDAHARRRVASAAISEAAPNPNTEIELITEA